MYDNHAIDIVIPSFRLEEQILLGILDVDHPQNYKLNFYIVADNPGLEIPDSILRLSNSGHLHLIVNNINLGFAATRNNGIRLGNSKWVLLLDDDIVPEKNLIIAYAEAIAKQSDAIGFAGVTNFPVPMNSATYAMELHGMTGHFKAAKKYKELAWVPTANVVLNREKMDQSLFNEALRKGGEDIEYLIRNSSRFDEKYVSVPNAVVLHPWWDEGHLQINRTFRYGAGASQIAGLPAIKEYTYHDFTNTAETLFLLLLATPLFIIYKSVELQGLLLCLLITSELITTIIKSVYLSKKLSFRIWFNLLLLKNVYEAGYLIESMSAARFTGFAERIDMGFAKKNPGWFRLNKWKIIKICLIALGICVLLSYL